MKKCIKCLVLKPFSAFSPNAKNPDGLRSCCIKCTKQIGQAHIPPLRKLIKQNTIRYPLKRALNSINRLKLQINKAQGFPKIVEELEALLAIRLSELKYKKEKIHTVKYTKPQDPL